MEVSKIELKILIKEFLTASNRVLRAGFEIYPSELSKFIRFIDNHELISSYVKSCGEPEYNVQEEVEAVDSSYGNSIFSLGSTEEKEVANIYAVTKYLAENNYGGNSFVFFGYSSSNKFQDRVNGFGDEFIRILINHIENYLTRISMQMGLDDNTVVNVSIKNSNLTNAQVNVDSDGNSIVTNTNICDVEQLNKLISDLTNASSNLNNDDKQSVEECVEFIETISEEKPNKSIIKMALKTLKGIVGTTEFLAATTAIIQFVQQYL